VRISTISRSARRARSREAIKYGNESLLEKLLPVLEHLEMALAAAQGPRVRGRQSLQAGVSMICQQFKNVLAEAGLEELDALGKPFDPICMKPFRNRKRGRSRRPRWYSSFAKGINSAIASCALPA